MSSTKQNPLKQITIIHLALCLGPLFFGIVFLIPISGFHFDLNDTSNPFFFVVPFMAISSFLIGSFVSKKQLKQADRKDNLTEKLTIFNSSLIIRTALVEGITMLGIIAFELSSNLFFLSISVLLFIYIISLRPTKEKIKEQITLTREEERELDLL